MAKQPADSKSITKSKAGKTPGGNLVPQKHGGAIHQGAPANPVAGPGRPAEHIRADMRSKLDALLPDILERYRKGELDHVRVAEFLARYGLGQKDEVSVVSPEVKRRLQLQVEVIGSRTEWRTEELLQQIETIWTSNPTNK